MREFKEMANSHTLVLKLPTLKRGQQHGFCLCGPERHSLPCLGRMIMDFTSSRHFIHSIHHQAPPNQVTTESFLPNIYALGLANKSNPYKRGKKETILKLTIYILNFLPFHYRYGFCAFLLLLGGRHHHPTPCGRVGILVLLYF